MKLKELEARVTALEEKQRYNLPPDTFECQISIDGQMVRWYTVDRDYHPAAHVSIKVVNCRTGNAKSFRITGH